MTRRRNYSHHRSVHRNRSALYTEFLIAQKGVCGSCGSLRQLVLDHDHKCCPGRSPRECCWRGLLCNGCNTVIDRREHTAGDIRYLTQYAARRAALYSNLSFEGANQVKTDPEPS